MVCIIIKVFPTKEYSHPNRSLYYFRQEKILVIQSCNKNLNWLTEIVENTFILEFWMELLCCCHRTELNVYQQKKHHRIKKGCIFSVALVQ